MYNLYTSRRTMKGSNLIAGVASKSVIQKGTLVPATFFRTLAHIFELAKSGVSYKAITADDISKESLHADFALRTLPLWLLETSKRSPEAPPQEETVPAKSGKAVEIADETGSPRSLQNSGASDPLRPPLETEHSSSPRLSLSGKINTYRDSLDESAGFVHGRLRDADALFSSAPFWCYLYSHEKQQSRKTPPKTSKEMLQLYQQG